MIDEEKSFVAMCKFLLWLFTALLITFIGISGVFAETITDMTFSTFRTTLNTYSIAYNQYVYDTESVVVNMGATANGFAFEWITNYTNKCSGQTVVSGQMAIPNVNLNYDWYLENIKNIYYAPNIDGVEGTPCNWSVNPTTNVISFTCTTLQPNNNFIIGGRFQYRSNSSFNTNFRIYRTMNITCDNSATAIIENNNTNTQNIINNQNQNFQTMIDNDNFNTQDIIDNQSENTQDIIDNQNQNTEDMIESQKVCSSYDKDSIIEDGFLASADGSVSPHTGSGDSSRGVTDYIRIFDSSIISNTLANQTGSANNLCFYNINKSFISCVGASSYNNDSDITIPSNASYVRFTISATANRPQFSICNNGNQELNETSKGIFGKLKDLFNFFSSDEDADISGLNNMAGWLPPGPLDSIINLPLNFFQALTNTLSGTCTPVTLILPFVNQQLILPCFDSFMSQYITGFSALWTFIGVTVSVFILYNYLLSLYKWVDDTLTLRENNLPGYYDDNWGGGA